MRNNFRNTIGDQRKNNRNIANSVERKTFTANNVPMSHNRHHNQTMPNDQMARFITDTLLKIPSQNSRASISTSLKPNQKTLFSTISNLLFGIDHHFQQPYLDIQTIVQAMKFWGYPHTINKTIFNPVGAPHTWNTCMQIMYFLAQIFVYYFQYKNMLQQTQMEQQRIDIQIECFRKNDISILQQKYKQQKQKLLDELKDLQGKNQIKALDLKGTINSVDSLQQLQRKQNQLRDKLELQQQNVIQLDQSINRMQQENEKIKDETQQIKIENIMKKNKMEALQNQIMNQELTPEEVTQIQCEIQDLQIKINKFKQKEQESKEQYHHFCKISMEAFIKFQSDLSDITDSILRYQDQLNSHHIQMPRPKADHNKFSEILDVQDITNFEHIVRKEIFFILEIHKILQQQNSLYRILEAEQEQYKKIEEEEAREHNIVNEQMNNLRNENKMLKKRYEQYRREIEIDGRNMHEISMEGLSCLQIIQTMETQKKQLEQRQIDHINQIQRQKQEMMETIEQLKHTEQFIGNQLRKMEELQNQRKKKYEQILQRIYEGFKFLNHQLNGQ